MVVILSFNGFCGKIRKKAIQDNLALKILKISDIFS
jgi:hypothetical protein